MACLKLKLTMLECSITAVQKSLFGVFAPGMSDKTRYVHQHLLEWKKQNLLWLVSYLFNQSILKINQYGQTQFR